jgi:hypothetical protein
VPKLSKHIILTHHSCPRPSFAMPCHAMPCKHILATLMKCLTGALYNIHVVLYYHRTFKFMKHCTINHQAGSHPTTRFTRPTHWEHNPVTEAPVASRRVLLRPHFSGIQTGNCLHSYDRHCCAHFTHPRPSKYGTSRPNDRSKPLHVRQPLHSWRSLTHEIRQHQTYMSGVN